MVDKTSLAVVLKPDKTSSLLVCGVLCFFRMLISNIHKSIIVMNSLDTRFSRNVFEAVQKTLSTCFIGSKTTQLLPVVLNPNTNTAACVLNNTLIIIIIKMITQDKLFLLGDHILNSQLTSGVE